MGWEGDGVEMDGLSETRRMVDRDGLESNKWVAGGWMRGQQPQIRMLVL